ncbi:MAG: TonB-dependent receptor [Luteitalea sp.]|nr:TonB-dependent receptor [Luteitalea sp.]
MEGNKCVRFSRAVTTASSELCRSSRRRHIIDCDSLSIVRNSTDWFMSPHSARHQNARSPATLLLLMSNRVVRTVSCGRSPGAVDGFNLRPTGCIAIERGSFPGSLPRSVSRSEGHRAPVRPESHTVWSFWPAGLYQATWRAPMTSRFLLDAGASLTRNDFPGSHTRSPGVFGFTVPLDNPSILETSTGFRYNARFTYSPIHIQYRVVERFSASYVTGSHAFKAGFQWQQGYYDVESWVNSDSRNAACLRCPVRYQFLNGVPLQVEQTATPHPQENRIKADLGIFVQDQWAMRRLTLNYGLRLDYFNSYVPAQQIPATPWGWIPERNFAPVSGVPEWTDLNPLVGASYDLFGNGRTAMKMSFGRYVGVLGTDVASANNPINTSVNAVLRTWNDTNQRQLRHHAQQQLRIAVGHTAVDGRGQRVSGGPPGPVWRPTDVLV